MAGYRTYGSDDKPKPRNDAYTGLLVISFFAMLLGTGFLLADYLFYNENKPKRPALPQIPADVAVAPKGDAPAPAAPKEVAKPAPKDDKPKEGPAKPAPKDDKKDDMKKDDAKKDDMKKDAKKDEMKKD